VEKFAFHEPNIHLGKYEIMGDKSPKSMHKKISQKEARVASVAQKKSAVIASKQAAAKNK
jgi:hypothetical protein